ncbi:DUF5689 domain-containing protein [Niabella hirudinis]|uniref:DUF5689 domain-containing protein n=1 Tax=Niabella hirudinis TaxID=1285929 RepID=UPI003EBA21A9
MKTYLSVSGVLLICTAALIISCNPALDVPPLNADPEVPVNMTIAVLKDRYQGYGIFQKIYDDITITGVVTANDQSGNFYKQIVIQDETAAIPVLMDGNNIYTSYPLGRRVFVRLKGMMLGDYGGTIQLGLDSVRDGAYLNLGRIPVAQFDQFIVKGSFGNAIVPSIITPADLTTNIKDPLQSMLVQLEGFEFAARDTSKTYADPAKEVSAVNFTLHDCGQQSIVLRNSSYASFAALKIPGGSGTITGIYSIFNKTQQLFIRDTGDVQFQKPRCGQGPARPMTIGTLRQQYAGSPVALDRYALGGTVISDAGSGNITAGWVVLQSGNSGVMVDLGSVVTYRTGDSVVLNLSNADSLVSHDGLLLLKMHKDFEPPAPIASARMIIPAVRTIQELKAALELPAGDSGNIESTLVTIHQASTAPGFFSGAHILGDGSGVMELYIQEDAVFASGILPSGMQSWTGFGRDSNGIKRFCIRNTGDVTGFTPAVPFAALFSFSGVSDKTGVIDPTPLPAIPNLVITPFKAVGVGDHATAGGRFSFSGWPAGAANGSDVLNGAVDADRYYELTIEPSPGTLLNFFRISFTLRRSGTGVRQVVVRSNRDLFKQNLPVVSEPGNKNIQILPDNILQVSDASVTDNSGCVVIPGTAFIALKEPVTLRFYGFNSESAGGTFSMDDVIISGSVH